jgi:DNA primase
MTQTVDFRAIKAAVNMADILVHYGLLEQMETDGGRITGLCPFHEEDTPSFHTTPDRRGYHCFGCQAKGNVIAFVRQKENLVDDWQAARQIQAWFHIPPQDSGGPLPAPQPRSVEGDEDPSSMSGEPTAPLAATPQPNRLLPWQLEGVDPGHPYLQTRGLQPATIRYFGLGYYAGRGMMTGRIVIPIHNAAGELVAYAGRWPGKTPPPGERKYKLPPGFTKSVELYNLHRISPVTKTVILVEGYWSVFHLHQLGIRNVVALMGTSLSPIQCTLLGSRFQRVMVFFDGDAAGRRGTDQVLLSLASQLWVRAITCPVDQQPDDLSLEALTRLLRKHT